MKKMGAAMGKVKNPIPKYDPTEGVKKGVNKQGINDFNKISYNVCFSDIFFS